MVYRPTYYKDEQVYEVVTPAEESAPASTATASNDQDAEELLLTSPFMRGERVRAVQNALNVIGFDVGRADGIFGNATDQAVRDFQEWWEMPVTGVVDGETAQAIGEAYAWTISPETYASNEAVAEGSAEDAATPDAEGSEDAGEAAAPEAEDGEAATPTDDGAAETQSDDGAAEAQSDDSAAESDAGSDDTSQQGNDASDATEPTQEDDTTQSD